MKRRLASLLAALFFAPTLAAAETELRFSRPGETQVTTTTLPDGAEIITCDREAILDFYCLRTDINRETGALDAISASLLHQGWAVLGADTDSRPFTFIFTRPQAGTACPFLIMMTSADTTLPGRPALEAGMVEIQIAQTVDVTCLF